MLVATNAWIGNRSVGLPELSSRYSGDLRPKVLGGVEIQALVEIDTHAKSRLIDLEELSKPRAEERDHTSICVRESDLAISLRTLSGVERGPSSEECFLGQRPDAFGTHPARLSDLT